MNRTLLTLSLLAAGCGAQPHRSTLPGAEADPITLDEMRIVATRGEDGETVFDSYDASILFERGTALLQRGECREAVERYYDRLVREFPTSRWAVPALYNAGLCLHEGGELEASIPYYEGVIERGGDGRDARHAAFQLAQVLIDLERWERALSVAETLLLREDLEPRERLEGLARRAQALLGLGSYEAAERQARNALSYYRMHERTGAIRDPYFAAAANYVLAETLRLRSEAIQLPQGTAQEQHEVLDRRARLLLDAQREYFNTIRHTDPEWAAASGYRIGAMYDQLWHALMRAPIPPPSRELAEDAMPVYRQEYRQELARHIRPLLRHAIRYWELTLLMVERTGVQTDWADRTRSDLERMRGLLLEQTDPVAQEQPSAQDPAPDAGSSGEASEATEESGAG